MVLYCAHADDFLLQLRLLFCLFRFLLLRIDERRERHLEDGTVGQSQSGILISKLANHALHLDCGPIYLLEALCQVVVITCILEAREGGLLSQLKHPLVVHHTRSSKRHSDCAGGGLDLTVSQAVELGALLLVTLRYAVRVKASAILAPDLLDERGGLFFGNRLVNCLPVILEHGLRMAEDRVNLRQFCPLPHPFALFAPADGFLEENLLLLLKEVPLQM